MRFLIMPIFIFILMFVILRTSNIWSTKKNWKRIALETGVAFAATLLSITAIGAIVVLFN
jgi:hypothetical protein